MLADMAELWQMAELTSGVWRLWPAARIQDSYLFLLFRKIDFSRNSPRQACKKEVVLVYSCPDTGEDCHSSALGVIL
jgi:hypothetical protein